MNSARRPAELVVAAFLTWIAGYIDAVGFLVFAKIYTANMSGNSVALGISLSEHQWSTVLFRFWPILFYVCGLIFARSLIEIGARRNIRRIASIAFACEVILLGTVRLVSRTASPSVYLTQYLGIALLSIAMGIQTAALTRFSAFTVHTGFVTGTLVKFAEQLVAFGTLVWDTVRTHKDSGEILPLLLRQRSARVTIFLGLLWTAYVVGAAFGAWALTFGQSRSLVWPILCLLVLIVIDVYNPLAIQDEKEQFSLG